MGKASLWRYLSRELNERTSHSSIQRKSIPDKGTGKCKGPGAGMSLSCSRLTGRLVWLEQSLQVEDKEM